MLIIKKEKKFFFRVDLISRIDYRWIFREDLISRKQFLSLRYLMLSQWYCDILMRQVLQHSNSIKSLLHYVSINLFCCTPLLFFSFILQFDISVFWPVWALDSFAESSVTFYLDLEFLSFLLFGMLWMLVTVNKAKCSLRKTVITFSKIPDWDKCQLSYLRLTLHHEKRW